MIWVLAMTDLLVRPLQATDVAALARLFADLSDVSRGFYGPHPLTADFAQALCAGAEVAGQCRWLAASGDELVAYLLLDDASGSAELTRLQGYGQPLPSAPLRLFAPLVAEAWQSRGVMNAVMPQLLQRLVQPQGCALLLLGGVQAGNGRALGFYRKWGFAELGRFHWQGVDNIDMLRLP